jgi:hypothetical protein
MFMYDEILIELKPNSFTKISGYFKFYRIRYFDGAIIHSYAVFGFLGSYRDPSWYTYYLVNNW